MNNRIIFFIQKMQNINKTIILIIVDIVFWFFGFVFGTFNKTIFTNLSGIFFCLAILIAYYGLLFYVLSIRDNRKYWQDESTKILFLFIIFSGFVFILSSKERFIYFWDYGNYWYKSLEYSQELFSKPISALFSLFTSINNDEYNLLIPALLTLPMKIIGKSYVAYVLIIFSMFAFPMSLFLSLSINRLLHKFTFSKNKVWVNILIILIFPGTLIPILMGYPDVAGLLFISALWLLTFSVNWFSFNIKSNTAIGILLVLILFHRRYYAFFVVGYIIGLIAYVFFRSIRENKLCVKEKVKNFLLNLIYIGGFSLTILLTFFREFIIRGINSNYVLAYSAYKQGNLTINLQRVLLYFGILTLLLIIIAIIFLASSSASQAYLIFIVLSSFITVFLFLRIQSFSLHHYYLILSQSCFLIIIGIFYMVRITSKSKFKILWITALFLPLVFNFFHTYSLFPKSNNTFINKLVSYYDYEPRIRNDVPDIMEIYNYLNSYWNEQQSKVYVIASSVDFNDDILRKLFLPDQLNAAPFLSIVSHVDLRDGFPIDFLYSDLVLVAEPIQYHLNPEDQQVIGILANEFFYNGIIRKHYIFLTEFKIKNDICIKIYEKQTEFSSVDLSYLSEKFNSVYPEYPELFRNKILSIDTGQN